MANERDILRQLAAASRNDGPPLVDVSDRVLRRLAAPAARRPVMLWAFSAASSLAAAACLVLAVHVLAGQGDALGDFLQSMTVVIQ